MAVSLITPARLSLPTLHAFRRNRAVRIHSTRGRAATRVGVEEGDEA